MHLNLVVSSERAGIFGIQEQEEVCNAHFPVCVLNGSNEALSGHHTGIHAKLKASKIYRLLYCWINMLTPTLPNL